MKYARLYATQDGSSHFQDIEFKLDGPHSDEMKASSVHIRNMDVGFDAPWHTIGRRYFMTFLEGVLQLTASDGEVRLFHPGDMLLIEDTTGKGHYGHNAGNTPVRSVWVALE
jgi:quercetin dioxygenase-like cupin family protein